MRDGKTDEEPIERDSPRTAYRANEIRGFRLFETGECEKLVFCKREDIVKFRNEFMLHEKLHGFAAHAAYIKRALAREVDEPARLLVERVRLLAAVRRLARHPFDGAIPAAQWRMRGK